jgi:hypothetical protein
LHENVKDIPLLIHHPPEIVAMPVNVEKDLIQVPCDARFGAPRAELIANACPTSGWVPCFSAVSIKNLKSLQSALGPDLYSQGFLVKIQG